MQSNNAPEPVVAGVRAYMLPKSAKPGTNRKTRPRNAPEGFPPLVLLFDTETTVDPSQRLRFGSYRLCEWEKRAGGQWSLICLEEGLFYGDDLPKRAPKDFRALQRFALSAVADTPGSPGASLPLYSRSEFVDRVLWKGGMVGQALMVGFNLPFDLSRLAVAWEEARGRDRQKRFVKGYTLVVWGKYSAATDRWTPNTVRPRLRIKHRDSKSADMQCTRSNAPELQTRSGVYQGRFLDLKTFAHALTDKAHSLKSLAEALGTAHRKTDADYSGLLTPQYIEYNRQDLRVSQECLEGLRAEFERHPVEVEPWHLRSPASLAKAYLRAAGITPPARRTPKLPERVFGATMTPYFGGRTEYHIPRLIVPVVYTDFLSMYPTVQALAKLREWLTADHFTVRDSTRAAQSILKSVTVETLLNRATWPTLRFFALVLPQDDILPVRAQFNPNNENYSIAVTRLSAEDGLWYSGFDIAASILLTGRIPKIIQAFSLEPVGTLKNLTPISLRGQVTIDPRAADIFQTTVELRRTTRNNEDLAPDERDQLSRVLKTVANSGSYGIFAEMNPQDLPDRKTRNIRVIGSDESFEVDSTKPEEPGEYCFPPMATTITAAARLLLALLERLVTDLGGTFGFCDTDSMAIAASQEGGFLPCPGGNHLGPRGEPGFHPLSWAEVEGIVARLEQLNPYGAGVGPLLKIEDENFGKDGQIQVFTYGLSAKRYCLFRKLPDDNIEILKASEHGLGQLLNPTDPDGRDRGPSGAARWIEDVWRGFVLSALGKTPVKPPAWFSRPAVARHSYSSPALLRPGTRGETDLSYFDGAKPFNFGLTCYLHADGAPAGTDMATCHLVGPYERDPRKWLTQRWVDTATGVECGISTTRPESGRIAHVKSVADVIASYAAHAESKSAGPDGQRATSTTVGLLRRRHVTPVYVYHLGKETNQLEEVAQGQVRDLADVQEMFESPKRSAWDVVYRPLLVKVNLQELAEESGIRDNLLRKYRAGTTQPTARQRKLLVACLKLHASG